MIRELIIKRINEIKIHESGFSKSLMKWQNVKIEDTHISEFDFDTATNIELVALFEVIIKRYYRQA